MCIRDSRYSYTIYNNGGEPLALKLSSPDNVTLIGEHSLLLPPFSVLHGRILVKSTGKLEQLHLNISGGGIALNRESIFL